MPELDPAKWPQFEATLKRALSMPPQHRVVKKPPAKRTSGKGRARVGKAKR